MLAVLQRGFRPREPRIKVLVPCRMNRDGQWADACIHNMSSRGMLVACDAVPKPGSYVELRRGTLVLIGRVMWAEQRFFGVRTQERLSVDALVNEPRRRGPPANDAAGTQGGMPGDRRSDRRLVAEGRHARQVERNRHASSMMQYVVLIAAGAAAAGLLGSEVYTILGSSAQAIGNAMGGG